MDNFGIPSGPAQDLESVQQQLEQNAAGIVSVVNGVAGSLVSGIDANAAAIDKVQKRMANVLNSQIRKNGQRIQGVASALISPLNQQIAQNAQVIAGAQTDPAIASAASGGTLSPALFSAAALPAPGVPTTTAASQGAGGVVTVTGQSQGCPPGWTLAGEGYCALCVPGSIQPCAVVPAADAWRTWAAQQRSTSVGSAGGITPFTSPGQPPPPVPPAAPPPSPPPSPPLIAPPTTQTRGSLLSGGGQGLGSYVTVASTGTASNASQGGACQGPYKPGELVPYAARPGWSWVTDAQGMRWYCPDGVLPPSPPSPPSPPATGASPAAAQCPQTYSVVQGPPCPQYVAIAGTAASWAAGGFQLPSGWSVVQIVTDTPDNVSNLVNTLVSRCVAASIPAAPPTPSS